MTSLVPSGNDLQTRLLEHEEYKEPSESSMDEDDEKKEEAEDSTSWPKRASERTKLYFPTTSKVDLEAEDAYVLNYNERRGIICVVHESTGGIVDSFSPVDDVIGAELQIEFNEDGDGGGEGGGRTAYLNVYCYPRAPSVGIAARCFGPSTSSHRKNQDRPFDDDDDDDEGEIDAEDKSKMGYRHERHRHLKIAPCFDFTDARSLVRAIRRLAKLGHYQQQHIKTPLRPTKYLVVINPFSGTAKSHSIYKSTVRKMLVECGVEHDLFVTRYAGHASERMQEDYRSSNDDDNGGAVEMEEEGTDVAEYDGVVAMGGDGILYEMMQTLWTRTDSEELMDRLRVGIVGCGTSNGLAKGLLYRSGEKYDALESTFLICKGNTSKMDLSSYQTRTKQYISFLTYSWALIADIDIESECLRFAGVLRHDIWALWRVINLKRYRGRLSYLPPPSSYKDDDVEKVGVSQDDLAPLNEPVPSSWTTIEEDFILFWACQQTHGAWNVHNSPDSELQDGIFRIFIIREPCSRLELAKILLSFENASHVSYKRVEFIECVAFRLEPITLGSFNDLDGEVIEAGPIQARVLPAATNIFTGSMNE